MKAYLVWSKEGGEGVVFDNEVDAKLAATGKYPSFGHFSTLADQWREYFGEDGEQYEITEIEIP